MILEVYLNELHSESHFLPCGKMFQTRSFGTLYGKARLVNLNFAQIILSAFSTRINVAREAEYAELDRDEVRQFVAQQ
jgi:hypothetical protein